MKVGDMVRAAYHLEGSRGRQYVGIITHIEKRETLFSDKYAITEKYTEIGVLVNGEIMTFEAEEDSIEVINEGR